MFTRDMFDEKRIFVEREVAIWPLKKEYTKLCGFHTVTVDTAVDTVTVRLHANGRCQVITERLSDEDICYYLNMGRAVAY